MTPEPPVKMLHPRYDWLDQARGLVVLLLIVSMATAEFAGDMVIGEPTLGPPMFNHGYYYFNGSPALITFIDSGQALFVLVMGFAGYTAFISRLKKRGRFSAWSYAARRVFFLYALAGLDSLLLSYLERGVPDWAGFFYGGTFSGIALGSLAAFGTIALCPSADKRIYIAGALMLTHALLFEFPIFDHHGWLDDVLELPTFPFMAMGLCVTAIVGSCFGQWHVMDSDDPAAGFRTRIAPASMIALVAAYCMDWIQPAEHHDLPAALQLQAIYLGGFMLTIFFTFGNAGIRFPLLSALGKNLMLMFIVGGLGVSIYWSLLPTALLVEYPLLAMVCAGIVPIAALGSFALFLEKRGVMVRA